MTILGPAWPPKPAPPQRNIDLSCMLSLASATRQVPRTVHLKICKDDNWTPVLEDHECFDHCYEWGDFENRIARWMAGEEIGTLGYELYDVSTSSDFSGIIGKPIDNILKIQAGPSAGEVLSPFGVRFVFEDDYVQVFANSDGTAVETNAVQGIGNLNDFCHFGELIFESFE